MASGHRADQRKQIRLRVPEDEAHGFEQVASHFGLSITSMIRMLVAREYDAIANLGRSPPQAYDPPLEKADVVRDRSGISLSCPTFFQIKVYEAKQNGTPLGYEKAGWHLANELSDMVAPETDAEAELHKAFGSRSEPEVRVLEWMKVYLPRCYDLVPENRMTAFARGIARAIDPRNGA